jgi:hypothetical protein
MIYITRLNEVHYPAWAQSSLRRSLHRLPVPVQRVIIRQESKINEVHGQCLVPSMVTFHTQLAWRNYLAN